MPKTIRPFPPKVPTSQIAWLLGRVHVMTSDREVIREFWKRCHGPALSLPADQRRSFKRATVRAALLEHKRNRRMYRQVNAGYFGDLPLHQGLR